MAWRLAFAGTPLFAATILRRLLDSPHRVALVYTQPDRPAGRGRKLAASPVRLVAEAAGVEARTPTRLTGEAETLGNVDCLVVAAYRLFLPDAVLDAPKHGCLNVHPSLLPRWRGAAPVERAIMAGDAQTGVSIMRVSAKLDAGPVYRQRSVPLDESATGSAVTAALAELGAETLLEVLAALPDLPAEEQDETLATYARKLTAEDARIDWQRPATDIARQVRALSGRLAAYATLDDDVRLRILAARPAPAAETATPGTLLRRGKQWCVACGEGELELETVQLNRGKGTPLAMQSAVNGYPALLREGTRFGQQPVPSQTSTM